VPEAPSSALWRTRCIDRENVGDAFSHLLKKSTGSSRRRQARIVRTARAAAPRTTVGGHRCTAGRRRDASRKSVREMSSGAAPPDGCRPAQKVATTARSRRQRMSTGAQVRWRIMGLITDGQIGSVDLCAALCGLVTCGSAGRHSWRARTTRILTTRKSRGRSAA
jgi:hypothetical protein